MNRTMVKQSETSGDTFLLNRAGHLIVCSSDNREMVTKTRSARLGFVLTFTFLTVAHNPQRSVLCIVHQRDVNVRFDLDRRAQSASEIKKRTLHPLTSLCVSLRKYCKQVYQDTKKKNADATLTTSLLPIRPGLLLIGLFTCACTVFLTAHARFVVISCKIISTNSNQRYILTSLFSFS